MTATRSDGVVAAGTSYPALTVTVDVAVNAPPMSSTRSRCFRRRRVEYRQQHGFRSDADRPCAGPRRRQTHSGPLSAREISAIRTRSSSPTPAQGRLPAWLRSRGISAARIDDYGHERHGLDRESRDEDRHPLRPSRRGASYPALTVTVNVTADAPTIVTNTATVSGGGEFNATNDMASDSTTVLVFTPLVTGVSPSLTGGALIAAPRPSPSVTTSTCRCGNRIELRISQRRRRRSARHRRRSAYSFGRFVCEQKNDADFPAATR